MKTTLQIQNLKCNGCATTIKNNLKRLQNIKDIDINIEDSLVSFIYKGENDLEVLKKELHRIGYPIAGENNNMQTKAKSYVSCAVGRMNK